MTEKSSKLNKSKKEKPTESPEQSVAPELKEVEAADASGAGSESVVVEDLSAKPSKMQRAWLILKRNKKISIPGAVFLLIAVLFAVPLTRYALAGLVVPKDAVVLVMDQETKKPVSKAQVVLGGKTVETDNRGFATIHTKVGYRTFKVNKKYYVSFSSKELVPIGKQKSPIRLEIKATGRQVALTVLNKVSGKPAENITVKALDTEGKTDKEGKLTLVLPADRTITTATLSGEGYNKQDITIQVTDQEVKANTFQIVPSGKIYFLSKQTGKIDVVKTNLDGSERQVVLPGTGREEDGDTVLLASRDWKYLAFKARRDGNKAKLYLIDASNDKLTTMDEGDATFTPVGWSNEFFVYQVNRNGLKQYQPKQVALKSFSAKSNKLAIIDETDATGGTDYVYAFENFTGVYIVQAGLVYGKYWQKSYNDNGQLAGKTASIISVQADGSSKQVLKTFDANLAQGGSRYMQATLYEPQGVYFLVSKENNGNDFYGVEDGKVHTENTTVEAFNKPYPTYLVSPDGKQTFWSEPRDGKNALFVGNVEGASAKQIANLSEYEPYGWFSSDYLLVSKQSSELYIMPLNGQSVLKIADYHKPAYSFRGYGYGYGGL